MALLNFDTHRGEIVNDTTPTRITYFKTFADTAPEVIGLDDFLEAIAGGSWSGEVVGVRGGTFKKRDLPAVALSGVFSGGHRAEHLVEHSGLICLDFDHGDNPGLSSRLEILKEDLAGDQFCRAAFTSAGGNGLAIICRIEGARHGEAFDALSVHYMQAHGLVADKACRDVTRLRFCSWDDALVENEGARVFKRYSLSEKAEKPAQEATGERLGLMTDTRRDEVMQALSVLSPDAYADWIQAGMAIHSEAPGLDGLALWREWSSANDTAGTYDADEVVKKWRTFGRGSSETVGIESIFKAAYDAGWTGPRALPAQGLLDRPKEERNPLPIVKGDTWAVTEEAPRDPVIEGLFDRGDKGDVIAPAKMKKSFFVMQMAMHVAAGRNWLGMEIPKARKVLVLQLEVADSWMHRRFNRMRKTLGMTQEHLANLSISNLRSQYGPETLKLAMEYIIENGVDMVVIDPLYKLSAGGETIEELKPIMAAFDTIAEQTGAAVVYVHHDAKGIAGDRDIRDRGAGSGVVGRDCDFRVVLTSQENEPSQTVLDVMPRNFPEPDSIVVQFDEGHFRVVDVAANPKTSKSKATKRDPSTITADEVFEALKDQKYPATGKQLRFLICEKTGVASGRKLQEFIASLGDMFAHDARLIQGELPPWTTSPNPAGRPFRAVSGWGTPAQFITEERERQAEEIGGMEI